MKKKRNSENTKNTPKHTHTKKNVKKKKQSTDIPVPRGRRGVVEPVSQRNVDIPVRTGGLQGFQDMFRRSVLWSRSLKFLMNFKILSLILGQQPHPHFCVMNFFEFFFFSHFSPMSKKCAVYECRSRRALELMDEAEESFSAFEYEYLQYNDVWLAGQRVESPCQRRHRPLVFPC